MPSHHLDIKEGKMGWFNGNPEKDINKLFTPNNIKMDAKKDRYWDHLLIGIFIVLAIIMVSIVVQAAF